MKKNEDKIKVFLVDDDAVFLKLLEVEFRQQGNFIVETYPTGEHCVAHLSHLPDIIVLDYHLDGINQGAMNGIETLDAIKALISTIPVIMLSSQDKIDVAIACMHHGAADYVVKTETAFIRLQKIITTVLLHQKTQKRLNWYIERM